METVKLKTLYDLLRDGFTAAQLATAVEKHGLSGWDRYGRFGEHKPKSGPVGQALDALAKYHQAETEFLQDLEDNPPQDASDAGLREFPLDIVGEVLTLELHRFGWRTDKVPAIDRSEKYPKAPSAAATEGDPRDALLLVGALLDYMARRQKPPSQNQIIEDICSRYPTVYGLKVATLQKWFGGANRVFRDAAPVNQKKDPS